MGIERHTDLHKVIYLFLILVYTMFCSVSQSQTYIIPLACMFYGLI